MNEDIWGIIALCTLIALWVWAVAKCGGGGKGRS
jgi:hypothetical protein